MTYFDTSVILPYYCPEKMSVRAEKNILQDDRPTISTLTSVEIASALSRKVREKTISASDAETVWERYDFHCRNGYYVIRSIEVRHYTIASAFILKFNNVLRTLDALHLAVASEASLPVVTVDRQFSLSAKKLGISCRLLNLN